MKQKINSKFSKRRSHKIFVIGLLSLCIPVAMAKMPPPGKLYDVGGYKMHLDCRGNNPDQPTIILESGAGDFSATWGLLQDELAKHARVCSYDRSGFGWSERSGKDHFPSQVADELHRLLQAADVLPPYIMVGQSLGGTYVQTYTARYPKEVQSLILIDPSHEDQQSRMTKLLPKRIPKDFTFGQRLFLHTGKLLIPLGIPRFFAKATIKKIPEPLQDKYKEMMLSNKSIRTSIDDIFLIRDYFDEAKSNNLNFGSTPLIVIGAGKMEKPPKWSDEEFDILLLARQEMLMEIVQRSSNGRFVLAAESGHMVQWDQPELVIESILSLLD